MGEPAQVRSVSFVIPVYNEEDNVEGLYAETTAACLAAGLPYEIICVDDASTDRTRALLRRIQLRDKNIKIIELTENLGQTGALLCGLRAAAGDAIVTMDADLQNDPADMLRLLSRMREGFDFVNGWRQKRKDSPFRIAISLLANTLISARTGVELKDYGCGLTASSRKVVSGLLSCGASSRFIKPAMARLAGSVCEVAVSHRERKRGSSKYGFFQIACLGLDFLVNFNLRPARAASR